MLIRQAPEIRSSEITDPGLYFRRREFLRGLAAAGVTASLPAMAGLPGSASAATPALERKLDFRSPGPFATDDTWTDRDDATRYNNLYERGTDPGAPTRNPQRPVTEPTKVTIAGQGPFPSGR